MMRIITGRAKGTKLFSPEGEETRPTSERVKEAVFSMIQFDIEGRSVLDLFAGSGQLGLEAVSRGAASAVFVEKSKQAASVVSANIRKTKSENECTLFNMDCAEYIRRNRGRKADIIFIDPPYASGLYAPTLRNLLENDMTKPTTLIIAESGTESIFGADSELAGKFEVIKATNYGKKTFITILRPLAEEEQNER